MKLNNKAKEKPIKNENVVKEKTPLKKNHKALYKIAILVTNLVGFPLLLLLVALECMHYNESGIYKFTVFAPCLIVLLMWGITALLQMIIFRVDKKTHASFKHTMISCAVVPICCLGGLFLVLDIALPKLLAKATSNTILYEDIVVDAKGQHETILSKAQMFLYKNNLYKYEVDKNGQPVLDKLGKPVPIGTNGKPLKFNENSYPSYDFKQIQFEHWFSDENMDIFKPIFSSFDQAYQSFNGLAIEFALSEPDLVGGILNGNIPITVLASIALKTTPPEDVNGSNVKLDLLEILTLNKEPLVNAVKALIASGFDFGVTGKDPYTGADEKQALDDILNSVILHKEFNGVKWNVLQLLGTNPLSGIDPNKQIVQYEGTENEVVLGACLGYQDMAWLNSVDLLGIIICLMDCRDYFYIFGVVIGIVTYIVFVLKKQYLLTYGDDCLLLPKTKRRRAKEERDNWYYSSSSNKGVMNINNDSITEMESNEIQEDFERETKSLSKPSFADRFKKNDNEPKVAKEKAPKVEKVKKEKVPKPPKPEKVKKEKPPKPPKPEKVKKEKVPKPPKPEKVKKEKAPKPPKPEKVKKEKAPKPPKPEKPKKPKKL